jgi:hypothetical protein
VNIFRYCVYHMLVLFFSRSLAHSSEINSTNILFSRFHFRRRFLQYCVKNMRPRRHPSEQAATARLGADERLRGLPVHAGCGANAWSIRATLPRQAAETACMALLGSERPPFGSISISKVVKTVLSPTAAVFAGSDRSCWGICKFGS